MHLHHRCVQRGVLDEPDDRLDDECIFIIDVFNGEFLTSQMIGLTMNPTL